MPQKTINRLILVIFAVIEIIVVLMILLGKIPIDLKYEVLGIFVVLVIIFTCISKMSFFDLGLRSDNFVSALWLNLIVIFVSALVIFVLREVVAVRIISKNISTPSWYLLYCLVLAPMQEFIYRGFLFSQMKRAQITNPLVQILISGTLFAGIHLIYRDPLTLVLVMIIGFLWSWIYAFRPNLWAVMISHAVVGAIAIYFGMI